MVQGDPRERLLLLLQGSETVGSTQVGSTAIKRAEIRPNTGRVGLFIENGNGRGRRNTSYGLDLPTQELDLETVEVMVPETGGFPRRLSSLTPLQAQSALNLFEASLARSAGGIPVRPYDSRDRDTVVAYFGRGVPVRELGDESSQFPLRRVLFTLASVEQNLGENSPLKPSLRALQRVVLREQR